MSKTQLKYTAAPQKVHLEENTNHPPKPDQTTPTPLSIQKMANRTNQKKTGVNRLKWKGTAPCLTVMLW